MDLVIAETEPDMTNSLQFGLPESAAYITDRKQVHYPSISGNIFNASNENKYLRFVVTGEDNTYVDLSKHVCSLIFYIQLRQQDNIYVLWVRVTRSLPDTDATLQDSN